MENLAQSVTPLFGRRIDTSEVKSFLVNIGLNEQIEIANDDDSTYVTRPAQGFSLAGREPRTRSVSLARVQGGVLLDFLPPTLTAGAGSYTGYPYWRLFQSVI